MTFTVNNYSSLLASTMYWESSVEENILKLSLMTYVSSS